MTELDEALARFQAGDFEYAGGLSNHGPMAAEALVRLGHASLLSGFVDIYAPRLGVAGPPGSPIPAEEQPGALGHEGRIGDWLATFEAELRAAPWPQVLEGAVAFLGNGLFAAATHGLLRTAHAVRSLEQEETAVRVRELAHGLAYWAATFQELPGIPGSMKQQGWGPHRLLMGLEPVPLAKRHPGFFSEAVRVLDGDSGFALLIARADFSSQPWGVALSELCCTAARLYLDNPESRIAYVHAVTAPSSLRLIEPYLGADQKAALLGRAVQLVAALHAVSSTEDAVEIDEAVRQVAKDPAEIRYRAACSLQEHSIKFAEACLREDRVSPDSVFRLAAADAALHLSG